LVTCAPQPGVLIVVVTVPARPASAVMPMNA
jgi:hypothetical protein